MCLLCARARAFEVAGYADVEHTGEARHDVHGIEVLSHSAEHCTLHAGGALPAAIKNETSREILRPKEGLQDDRWVERNLEDDRFTAREMP